MSISYAVQCPNCGLLIKIIDGDTTSDELKNITWCYGCEEDITPTTDDIIKISMDGSIVTRLE